MRDMALGAVLFMMLPVASMTISDPQQRWTMSEALAGEVIAAHAIEVTAPPGPATENAIIAAAQMRSAGDPRLAKGIAANVVLGLTFSLLMAFNLAFLRHLRRVSAIQRRHPLRIR